jgi:uncharacterized membrane protein YbhN (UPF0104 family)
LIAKTAKPFLKAGISLAGMAYFLRTLDLGEVWSRLQHSDFLFLSMALCLYLLTQCLCACRWAVLSRTIGCQGTSGEFLRYYFIGMFLNLFLPTAIGGDLGRSYYLGKGAAGPARAVVSVLADRGIGFLALMSIASTSLFLSPPMELPRLLPTAVFLASFALLCGFLLPFNAKVRSLLSRAGKPIALAAGYWEKPRLLAGTLLFSILLQMSVVAVNVLVGISLGITLPWTAYIALVPLVSAVSMLPSIGGIGVRENAYVFFLGTAGVTREAGGAFASEYLVVLIMAGLLGGLVWILAPPGSRNTDR